MKKKICPRFLLITVILITNGLFFSVIELIRIFFPQVKAEMVTVLTPSYIRFLKSENAWPAEFSITNDAVEEDALFENLNRPQSVRRDSSSDESE